MKGGSDDDQHRALDVVRPARAGVRPHLPRRTYVAGPSRASSSASARSRRRWCPCTRRRSSSGWTTAREDRPSTGTSRARTCSSRRAAAIFCGFRHGSRRSLSARERRTSGGGAARREARTVRGVATVTSTESLGRRWRIGTSSRAAGRAPSTGGEFVLVAPEVRAAAGALRTRGRLEHGCTVIEMATGDAADGATARAAQAIYKIATARVEPSRVPDVGVSASRDRRRGRARAPRSDDEADRGGAPDAPDTRAGAGGPRATCPALQYDVEGTGAATTTTSGTTRRRRRELDPGSKRSRRGRGAREAAATRPRTTGASRREGGVRAVLDPPSERPRASPAVEDWHRRGGGDAPGAADSLDGDSDDGGGSKRRRRRRTTRRRRRGRMPARFRRGRERKKRSRLVAEAVSRQSEKNVTSPSDARSGPCFFVASSRTARGVSLVSVLRRYEEGGAILVASSMVEYRWPSLTSDSTASRTCASVNRPLSAATTSAMFTPRVLTHGGVEDGEHRVEEVQDAAPAIARSPAEAAAGAAYDGVRLDLGALAGGALRTIGAVDDLEEVVGDLVEVRHRRLRLNGSTERTPWNTRTCPYTRTYWPTATALLGALVVRVDPLLDGDRAGAVVDDVLLGAVPRRSPSPPCRGGSGCAPPRRSP